MMILTSMEGELPGKKWAGFATSNIGQVVVMKQIERLQGDTKGLTDVVAAQER